MFYKYRSFDSAYKYSVFERAELYFPKPSEFNDPFESKPNIVGLDTLQKRQKYVDSYIKHEQNGLRYKEKQALKRQLLTRLSNQDLIGRDIHKQLDLYGIFCTSKKWNHILMWSHYSESHKGFCMGFNFESEFDHDLGTARKVRYADKYPEFNPKLFSLDSSKELEELLVLSLATKSSEWSYEEEVRYIKPAREGGSRIYKFNEKKVQEVIVGACASDHCRGELIEIVEKHMPWVNIYQAKLSKSKYELYREPINRK